jgi:hypothetical protein
MQTTIDPKNQFGRYSCVKGALVFLMICGSGVAEGKHHHPSEQTQFSAEDDSVHKPAEIPQDVMTILKKDKWVDNILEDENMAPDKLPSSWFSASAIHLGSAKKLDFVVVGEPPLLGANTATFWVFLASSRGYELALKIPAHDLQIKNTRRNGYRDIEASAESAVTFYSALFRFDGKGYVKRSGRAERIP